MPLPLAHQLHHNNTRIRDPVDMWSIRSRRNRQARGCEDVERAAELTALRRTAPWKCPISSCSHCVARDPAATAAEDQLISALGVTAKVCTHAACCVIGLAGEPHVHEGNGVVLRSRNYLHRVHTVARPASQGMKMTVAWRLELGALVFMNEAKGDKIDNRSDPLQ